MVPHAFFKQMKTLVQNFGDRWRFTNKVGGGGEKRFQEHKSSSFCEYILYSTTTIFQQGKTTSYAINTTEHVNWTEHRLNMIWVSKNVHDNVR